MACMDTSNISELNLTPSRKRKRQFEKLQQQQEQNALKSAAATTSCFTNAAFSSTPKKILGKRRLQLNTNKENAVKFVPNVGLEVKSIAEIAKINNEFDQCSSTPKNPYEVLRKPPKKKKRQADEVACFENPALNLELPEKQFNPYEVVRDITQSTISNCFVNPALNLKIQDTPASRNPFEIQRKSSNDSEILNFKTQIDPVLRNPFEIPREMVTESRVSSPNPCNFKIGLPFIPTVGCRIDFRDLSMSQLTPSKLLAQKLVFSPLPRAKVSLGSIGEETTMDIGKELDSYQLELENSINEAKLRKNGTLDDIHSTDNYQFQVVDIEKKIKFTQNLTEILEDGENEVLIEETTEQTEHHIQINIQKDQPSSIQMETEKNPFDYKIIQESENNQATEKDIENTTKNPFKYDTIQDNEIKEDEIEEDLEELYGHAGSDADEEDSFDFETPAPFIRAYTKVNGPKLTVSKESLKDDNSNKAIESGEHFKKTMNVKNIIRKSIRKFMHPNQHSQEHIPDEEENREKPEYEKHNNGIMNAIRQSLRRRPAKNLLVEEEPEIKECEISIIDSSERTLKLKSNLLQTEYAKVEDLTNEKKHNIRSSIRKSTREVRNHFMKSVFHKKHEEYDFNK